MAVSVIIPTFNESACIKETIQSLRRQQPGEIIVVDGGSSDDTPRLAQMADVLLTSQPGRARQMHAGAERAAFEHLLFLHADCTLEAGALTAIDHYLRQPRIIAGCFTMRVNQTGWLFRSIDWCATARVKLTGLAYGDQGLFIRRADYRRLGGFPPLRFMEDVFFSRMLKKQGRLVVAGPRIFVSPRRWRKNGILRQTLRNWWLTAMACAGVHPDRLARYYLNVR